MADQRRHSKCGAVYRRTEAMAAAREVNSFECSACGDTMESWNTAWVPTYRLIIGPVRQPTAPSSDRVPGVRRFIHLSFDSRSIRQRDLAYGQELMTAAALGFRGLTNFRSGNFTTR
jgi:hypothetical protein